MKFAKENCGIHTARLTWWEPLTYPYLEELLQGLWELWINVDLTTNGFFLEEKIPLLEQHWIKLITVSINTLNTLQYAKVTGTLKGALNKVMQWLDSLKNKNIKVNINLTAVDSLTLWEVLDVIDYARESNFMMRICEPLYVISEPSTKEKKLFKEVFDYLIHNSKQVIHSACESVTYIEDNKWGRITIYHSLCDNRFCESCWKYLYLRLTSDRKLKPCLSRHDTEILISENPDDEELAYAFYSSIANMGKWPKDNIYGLKVK